MGELVESLDSDRLAIVLVDSLKNSSSCSFSEISSHKKISP
jgi:hypothetical protein